MSFPRYERYKDSGIEWLGEVPEHWEVNRLKYVADIYLSNVDKHTVEGQKAVILCNYVDVYKNSCITYEIEFMRATASDEQIERLSIKNGDVIITKDSEDPSDIGVPALVVEDIPGLVCGYHLAIIRPTISVGAFLNYLFRGTVVRSVFRVQATGMTRYALSKYSIENLTFSLPELKEQQTIAAFLDRETTKIDALIAEQQRLIELLKEKRQAVISHAVTKGLNPDAPMKDSGIEWLGEVPEHWEVKRIKHLCSVISKGTTPTTVGAEFTSEGIRFLKAENITEDGIVGEPEFYISEDAHAILSRSSLQDGDILVVIAGATTGKSVVIGPEFLPANTNQAVSFARLTERKMAHFISLWLRTNVVRNLVLLKSVQSAQPNLSMEDLGNIALPVPPQTELKEIEAFLASELAKLDALTAEAQTAITLLQERRTALISAAVTGKIDVRSLVAAQADMEQAA